MTRIHGITYLHMMLSKEELSYLLHYDLSQGFGLNPLSEVVDGYY